MSPLGLPVPGRVGPPLTPREVLAFYGGPPLTDSDLASIEERAMAAWIRRPTDSTYLQKVREYLDAAPTPEARQARKAALYIHLYGGRPGPVTGRLSHFKGGTNLSTPLESSRPRE